MAQPNQNWVIDRNYSKWVTIIWLILAVAIHAIFWPTVMKYIANPIFLIMNIGGLISLLIGGITGYVKAPNGGASNLFLVLMWVGGALLFINVPIFQQIQFNH